MRNSLEIIERIEMYLADQLSGQERSLFEIELADSPKLREMVENHQLIQQAIRRKAILQQVEMYAPNIGGAITFWGKFKWTIIFSSVLTLVALSFMTLYNREAKSKIDERITKHKSGPDSRASIMITNESKNPDIDSVNRFEEDSLTASSYAKIKTTTTITVNEQMLLPDSEKEYIPPANNTSQMQAFEDELSKNQEDQIENWIVQPIFDSPDVPASFPKGKRGISQFISENVQYPELAIESNIQGQIDVKFIVDSDGNICDAEVMNPKPEKYLLELEAIRLIESMPPWIPAENNGKKVKSWVKVPVNFMLK